MVNDSSLLITNGRLLCNGALTDGNLFIDSGIIADPRTAPPDVATLNAAGTYVLPGLVDLHTHGIGTTSAYDDLLTEFAAWEARHGATTFFPTLFGPPERTVLALERHLRCTHDLRDLPQIGGFRLESPYLAQSGGGASADLAPISEAMTHSLLKAGRGYIKIWDISPELPGAPEAIKELSTAGVVCSIAHTQATISQARTVVDAGARLVTHLYDTFVVPPITEPGVYPVGLIEYLLLEDRVICEIIGDGTHAHPLQVEMALRCATADRLAFVTDSNVGAGLPAGEFLLPNDWGWAVINGCNNGVRLRDRGNELAGSALTPIDAFRNAVRLFGQNIATASRLCSATPARLLGLNKGEISIGKDADLIILDETLELLYTIVGGKVVFRKDEG